tara:strand:+ start:128 stop:685 length:558 start_codon:yes stop_codon:yes gene_type:complete
MAKETDEQWLKRFHAGDPALISEVYREHFDAASAAVARYLRGPDGETVVQDIFLKMVSDQHFRENFKGGGFRAWLNTVARNRAIDFIRKHRHEKLSADGEMQEEVPEIKEQSFVGRLEARQLIEQFRANELPEKWRDVFEARFMRQLTQREAAAELKIPRTTIAYQEIRIRRKLEAFFLNAQEVS